MRYYDGSLKWDKIEAGLCHDGYTKDFACSYLDKVPVDLQYTGRESGWELRRKLKVYCEKHDITEFRIVRNTSYHSDLHGQAVYELWTRPVSRRK